MRNPTRARVGSYQMSGQRIEPVARVWPNGEFSLGYSKSGEQSPEQGEWTWTGGSKGLTEDELNVRLECLDGWLECVAAIYSVSGKLACQLLTLSHDPNSRRAREPVKYGLEGLTGYGKKMIRSGAYLMEEILGRDDVVMITLTVPTMSKPERIAVAKQWGRLTNRLVEWLSRELGRAGRQPTIIGCVEVQSARLQRSGQAYLHLHLICPAHANRGGRWAIDVKKLVSWWKGALERVTGSSLTHAPRVETALVKKSVEAYLAKYLSKGDDDCMGQFVADLGYECVPGQWWFCSAPMREAIKRGTLAGRNCGALMDAVVHEILDSASLDEVEYLLPVTMEFGGRPVTVGWVGRLKAPLLGEIRAMLDKGDPTL